RTPARPRPAANSPGTPRRHSPAASGRDRPGPRAAHQLLDRDPANEMLPPQLGPPFHVNHCLLLALDLDDRARLTSTPDASATAQGGQISTGEGGSVSHRRGQKFRSWI